MGIEPIGDENRGAIVGNAEEKYVKYQREIYYEWGQAAGRIAGWKHCATRVRGKQGIPGSVSALESQGGREPRDGDEVHDAFGEGSRYALCAKRGRTCAARPYKIRASSLKISGSRGQFPYTRGIHPNGYRGKIWTMRQFAGFGTPEDTNERFKYLLAHGQTGLSTAFDLPTLMGRDADDPWSEGEVGICGVAISSLKDMETLFAGIPLDKVSTSMTINSPAAMIFAYYLCVAEQQGVPFNKLRGTLQNDILKEYIAQKEFIYPPEPSMRIITDMIEFCTAEVPKWNPVSVSGYHIREAGSTAAQELAFTLADGFCYVEHCIARGMDVDEFAPRLSFFFNSHIDFFEEIAKLRAARRIWARRLKEKYGAKTAKSLSLRFHTQTAGCSLTAQQPENNIVRTAYEALAECLGVRNRCIPTRWMKRWRCQARKR